MTSPMRSWCLSHVSPSQQQYLWQRCPDEACAPARVCCCSCLSPCTRIAACWPHGLPSYLLCPSAVSFRRPASRPAAPHRGDLAVNVALGITLLWLPLSIAGEPLSTH
jgi:hypothetical protein